MHMADADLRRNWRFDHASRCNLRHESIPPPAIDKRVRRSVPI
jgi:hypothetical protein